MFPTFDVAEIAEEAAERAGVQLRSGYLLRSARRSLELLSIEWGNRGLNLWTIETETMPLVQGQVEYPLPDDTIDLVEHNLRRINLADGKPSDFPLTRMSIDEYSAIPRKLDTGRPTIIHIKRRIHPSFVVWCVPSDNSYWLASSRLRRMASVGAGGTGEPDLPWRFVPAMTAGLAYYLCLKNADAEGLQQRLPVLKAAYEEQFTLASDEDRDRASVKWVPWGYPIV